MAISQQQQKIDWIDWEKVARLHVELLTDDYPPVDETIQSSVKVTEPQRLQAATRPVIKLAKH